MTKTLSILGLSLLAMTSCSSTRITPSNTFVTFEVAANDVREISSCCGINVIYTQSPQTSVKVNAPENYVDYIKVTVDEGELEARLDFGLNNVSFDSGKITVYVNSPVLNEIDVNSAASVTVSGGLKISSDLDIESSSSASVLIDGFEGGGLDIDSSSSATVKINSVKAAQVSAEASSSATIVISDISADKVSSEANSSAEKGIAGLKCPRSRPTSLFRAKAPSSTSKQALQPKSTQQHLKPHRAAPKHRRRAQFAARSKIFPRKAPLREESKIHKLL